MSAAPGVAANPSSVVATAVGVMFARIAAEFILIVFRINEHLGAIRNRGEM